MKQRVLEILFAIIKRNIDLDATPESNLKTDLNMDSLDLVEFGINVEMEFNGISIPDGDLAMFHDMTVDQIADYLMNLLPEGTK